MTDARREASESAVIREIIRRAGHEIRNALSGVGVNLEVVRSRCSRNAAGPDVLSFAERAQRQLAAATVLTNGLLALVDNAATGRIKPRADAADKDVQGVELAPTGDASVFLSDIQQLTSAIGVSVEQRGANVILKVLPEGQSYSKD